MAYIVHRNIGTILEGEDAPGSIYLGMSPDKALANARELIEVLDAFVRPWTTDGSVPHGADVELLLVNGSVGQGYVAGDDWWLDRGRDKIPLAPDQVRGWRHLAPIKVERGRIVDDGAATAPTGAQQEE